MSLFSLIPPPYGIVAVGIGIVILSSVSFYEGHHLAVVSEKATAAEQAQLAAQKYQAKDLAYNQIAQQLEASKNEHIVSNQAVSKVVTRIITKPIYSNVCLDSDGLSAANAALAGQPPSTGGTPSLVPTPDTTK